jgi:NADPH-dependent ferric siderophore reductase
VLLADETGLPAVGRWLESWPAGAGGIVAVEIDDASERQDLPVPEGVELVWLERDGAPRGTTTLLGDFAATVRLPEGVHSYVWAAAEAISLKPVRRWARATGHGKGQADVSGYWRRGKTQEEKDRPGLVDHVVHALDHLLRREH